MCFSIRQKRTSLLAVVCAAVATLVIAGCVGGESYLEASELSSPTYKVTVSGPDTSAMVIDSCVAGAIVTVKAGVSSSGSSFKRWTTKSKGVNFAHADSAVTTFTMPANAVEVTADFEGDSAIPYILSVRAEPIAASKLQKTYRGCLLGGRYVNTNIIYHVLFAIAFSIATVFCVCRAYHEKRNIKDIKKKRNKWSDQLQQTIRSIEASRDIDALKKSAGKLNTLFSPFDSHGSLAYSNTTIKTFVAELESETRDKDDFVTLKSEISDLVSGELTKNGDESKQELDCKKRWKWLWILMAVFSFLLFAAFYCGVLANYSCLVQENGVTDKCIGMVGCILPNLSVLLLYCIIIINIGLVCTIMKSK